MRYIIDVTQLVHWPGNLTGIPRVMDELAIRFHTHNVKNVIYVSWVKELGEMCEVDFLKTRPHRGKGIDYIYDNTATRLSHVSPKIGSPLRRIVKKIAAKSRLDRTQAYKKMASKAFNHEMQKYKVYRVEKSDRMFIGWGEWWDQNWLNKIKTFASEGSSIYPVCHDILPMLVPQFSGNSSSLADFITQVFPVAKSVIVPSESTKRDLTEWMKNQALDVPDIKIFSLGEDFTISEAKISDSDMIKKYKIKKNDYLVYVSTIEPRKNHTLIYYTYKLAASRGISLPKLLIIGRVGHDTSQIIKFIKEDPEVNHLIKICDYVVDDELNWLYKNCKFTIFSSFYEGNGITVIESIARGKPAVCSSNSSLNEISDRFVIRFNPASTDECLTAITEMLKPTTLKKYTKNTQEYSPLSWDGSFQQVLNILKGK